MIPRYSNPEMARIWADEQKYEYWRRVEVAVCEAWSELGVVPADALPAIRAATFDLKRIDEIFQETRHDVIAFVRSMASAVSAAVGDSPAPRRGAAGASSSMRMGRL